MPPGSEPAPVAVPAAVADAMLAHAAKSAPREACGLLVGRDAVVQRAVAARNLASEPTRYEIAPQDHFAAVRAARDDGLEVIGAYHSHPASPAVPSPTDREAAFGGFLFVIASPVPRPHLRAWELRDGNFVERPLVRT
jgi:proteasome lid subunit RPN8/RPN11